MLILGVKDVDDGKSLRVQGNREWKGRTCVKELKEAAREALINKVFNFPTRHTWWCKFDVFSYVCLVTCVWLCVFKPVDVCLDSIKRSPEA